SPKRDRTPALEPALLRRLRAPATVGAARAAHKPWAAKRPAQTGLSSSSHPSHQLLRNMTRNGGRRRAPHTPPPGAATKEAAMPPPNPHPGPHTRQRERELTLQAIAYEDHLEQLATNAGDAEAQWAL